MNFYPPHIQKRFEDPFSAGEVVDANAVGKSGSFVCGAVLHLSLRIENGRVTRAKFKAAGCGFLIAAADLLCERIADEFAGRFDNAEVVKHYLADLGEVEGGRRHCLELACEALRTAIKDFRTLETAGWNGDEVLICTCFGVSEREIETAVAENLLATVEDVTRICKAGGGCGSCQPLIEDIVADVWRGNA